MPLMASRSDPVAVAGIAGATDQILDHLERRPGAALGLEGVRGLRQLASNCLARQESLVGPVAAGGEDLVRLEVVVGVAENVEIARVAAHEIRGPGPAERVHVAVGVIGLRVLAAGVRSEGILVAGVEVPVLRVLPHRGEVAVLRVAGGQIGAVEVLAQRVPLAAVRKRLAAIEVLDGPVGDAAQMAQRLLLPQ